LHIAKLEKQTSVAIINAGYAIFAFYRRKYFA